ncbi:MAG: transketolase [Dehalococcoidia bacterium]|nr:MAG: transketolase [Dehalococcoidia bacterium]
MSHQLWRDLARQLRVDSIRCSTAAGSGHPTSSLSAADLMAVLLASYLRYDWRRPESLDNDQLLFSKGHASPLLYSMFRAVGAISDEELMTYRKLGSRLQGHPTPALPWVKVATGSLGQGIGAAVGMALSANRLEGRSIRVWCLLGDSEAAEGSVWESFDQAADERLTNLIAILDVNRLGQTGETSLGWHTEVYAARARAFGWRAIEIDGHDFDQIDAAYREATDGRGPTLIVAKTVKGKGVSFLENKNGWHGKALSEEEARRAYAELGGVQPPVEFSAPKPEPSEPIALPRHEPRPMPTFSEPIATREAYGRALAALGTTDERIVVLDAEVGNSTYSEIAADVIPERFVQTYIREQAMVATAVGLQARGWLPFAATFGAFVTRAFDFIRMAAISRANLKICGSHAGVSIGEDGPSQMALEDLAMMRAVAGSVVLYPADGTQSARLVEAAAAHRGITYLRTTREKTPKLYDDGEFPIGGSRTLRSSPDDRVTVVAAGVTVFEALTAYQELTGAGIPIRVIDAYSVKPIDVETLLRAARETAGIVVVEDHHPEGGLGSAVLDAFADAGVRPPPVVKLAVRELPGSGTPAELRALAGIDAQHIVAAVRSLLR